MRHMPRQYTLIIYAQFHVIKDHGNEVLEYSPGLPTTNGGEYEHSVPSPEDIQMKILAHEIVQGLMRPKQVQGQRYTIEVLPKRKSPPYFQKQRAAEGWGIRVTMGFSVRKFARWLTGCMLASAVFAAVWLSCINKTDLQNAFVPPTLFLTFLSTILVMMQSPVQ